MKTFRMTLLPPLSGWSEDGDSRVPQHYTASQSRKPRLASLPPQMSRYFLISSIHRTTPVFTDYTELNALPALQVPASNLGRGIFVIFLTSYRKNTDIVRYYRFLPNSYFRIPLPFDALWPLSSDIRKQEGIADRTRPSRCSRTVHSPRVDVSGRISW
jgi:hypothetical protein